MPKSVPGPHSNAHVIRVRDAVPALPADASRREQEAFVARCLREELRPWLRPMLHGRGDDEEEYE